MVDRIRNAAAIGTFMAKSLIEPELCVEFPRIHVRVSARPPNVKALACELPARAERPLARWSMSELAAETERTGLVASISGSTIWRWLHNDRSDPRPVRARLEGQPLTAARVRDFRR